METKTFHRFILMLAACIFATTAVCSYGFHHFDEHFQILEFAGLKLGINQPSDLAWEYEARIRPTIQPAMVVVLVKVMKAIGILSPFIWTTVIRLLTGGFLLMAIYSAVSALMSRIDTDRRRLFIVLSYLFYFIPYISVRYSSETVASGFFLLGFSVILSYLDPDNSPAWWRLPLAGFLLGFSFICRFQCGIMIAGLFVWLIFIYRLSLSRLTIIALMIACVTGIGVLIDHWFYQAWVFTPYNYLMENIIGNSAKDFGSSPWYYYLFELLVGDARSLIKIVVALGAGFFILSQRKDIVAFIITPFILIHTLLAHKEMRFMIPIAFFVPYFIAVFWQYIHSIASSRKAQYILQLILFQALFINMLSLIAYMVKPADGQPLVYQYLYEHYNDKPHDIYYLTKTGNFYWGQSMLPMNFYNVGGHRLHEITASDTTALRQKAATEPILLIASRPALMRKWPVRKLYSSKPEWLQQFDLNDWMTIKNDDWIVYSILPQKTIIPLKP